MIVLLFFFPFVSLTNFEYVDAAHHTGPHPLTPANLVKHVAEASKAAPAKTASSSSSSQSLEFGQLAARYRRAPISEAEMEAIEVISTYKKSYIKQWYSTFFILI